MRAAELDEGIGMSTATATITRTASLHCGPLPRWAVAASALVVTIAGTAMGRPR
jgi:hypothetical protein